MPCFTCIICIYKGNQPDRKATELKAENIGSNIMSNLNLSQFIQANQAVKLHITRQDLSIPSAAVAHTDLSFLMDENQETNTIVSQLHAAFLEIQDRVAYDVMTYINLPCLVSTESAVVRTEIKRFLNFNQVHLIKALFRESDLTDEEIDYVETLYPNVLDYELSADYFADKPFVTVETQDATTINGTGFINEIMYTYTDKIVAETLYELVKQYFNPNAKYEDFTEYASELIKNKL